MNVIKILQDPALVANIQKYFGVERKPKKLASKNVTTGEDKKSKRYKLSQKSLRKRTVCEENLLGRYLEQISKEEIFVSENRNFLSPTDHKVKSHSRNASSASVVSNASSNSVQSWKEMLFGDVGGTEGSMDEDNVVSESENEDTNYVITNKFWYYLSFMATNLGDEVFFAVFFSFWAWNVDGAVLRRVIVIWMLTMYVGQALKDILKVPRPSCPPVIRLDPKWALEYGLPSTHAMLGASVPFSLLILSLGRYQLDWGLGLVLASVWCGAVCFSRLYLGMHSLLDILCGLALVFGLMAIILPWVDVLDHLALTHPAAPFLTIILTIAMVICYPKTDRWTPARGDTTVIVGVGCGSLLGSWLNYQLGIIREPSLPPPYTIIWPTFNMMGMSLLRTCIGLVIMVAVRAIFKSLSFTTICALLKVRAEDYHNKTGLTSRHRLIVEHFYKFITYIAIGFTFPYTAPVVFRMMGIERPTFYTEV